jgi:hypothetical protein
MTKKATPQGVEEDFLKVLPGEEEFHNEGFGAAEPEMTEYEERLIFGTVATLSQSKQRNKTK